MFFKKKEEKVDKRIFDAKSRECEELKRIIEDVLKP